jgi:hypothetical protein
VQLADRQIKRPRSRADARPHAERGETLRDDGVRFGLTSDTRLVQLGRRRGDGGGRGGFHLLASASVLRGHRSYLTQPGESCRAVAEMANCRARSSRLTV